jgi:D-alanyl-D-alanine carboxypeptidase
MLLARAIEKASTGRTRKTGPQLVADAKPAKRPQPKPVTKPDPPAKPSAPNGISVAQEDTAEPAALAGSGETAAAGPRISIAKVKTVSVLTAGSGGGGREGAPTMNPDLAQPVVRAAPQANASSPPAAFASAMARPDFTALKAQLSQSADAEPAAIEAKRSAPVQPSFAYAASSAANERGRPPSTLQAQLAYLESRDTIPLASASDDSRPALQAAAAGMAAPVPVPFATGVTAAVPREDTAARTIESPMAALPPGYHVQIGVYGSPADAQRAMAAAQTKAAHVLSAASPIAMPLTKGDKQLYRARFAGFDSASAANACNELRRSGLDCFVARAN